MGKQLPDMSISKSTYGHFPSIDYSMKPVKDENTLYKGNYFI